MHIDETQFHRVSFDIDIIIINKIIINIITNHYVQNKMM